MAFFHVFVVCLVTTAAAQTTEIIGACGETSYYGPSGVISSPNYPGNYYSDLYCDYNVYASTGSSLSFYFKSLHIEEGVDFVTISCPTNSSFSPMQYTGHFIPYPVSIPWCSQGRVNFRTDGSVVSTGFSLDYYVSVGGCGNTVYSGSNGYVTTPNWPSNYSNNLDCYNIIWVDWRSTFEIYLRSFELHPNCSSDWHKTRCLDNSDYDDRTFCGTYPDDYVSIIRGCSQMLLWFHSDNYENAPGFNIEYNVYLDEACGDTRFYGLSGVISSPNYPGSYSAYQYCQYTVHAPTISSMSFIFKSLNTELYKDFVRISSPANWSYPPQEYSGNVLPYPVSFPWCDYLLIYFSSDDSDVSTGFSLDYYISEGGCGNTVYTDSTGYVTSPNYPSYYGYNQNCSNIIWAPQLTTFHLIFLYFNLHSCCGCDWMEISCLDNSAYGPYKYCGFQSSFELNIYECSQLLLWFHSNGSDNHPGFKIQYNIYPEAGSTASTSTTTASTTTAIVPQNCGSTSYYGPSGVISSPNYPGNYSNDLSCDYYINASSLFSSIAVIFQAFDTQECCDYVTISCPTNSIYPSVRYSGASLPQPVSMPWCSEAAVNFYTDISVVSFGFSLDYHISLGGCGDTVYTTLNGIVSSPNYPSDYDNNQNCSNIIWTRLRSSFAITFQYMNLEECCDFVELSCLDNAEYGLHRFTGTSIPPKQTIPQCTQVLVWFYSDDNVVQTGFNLEYLATPDSDDPRQGKVPSNGAPNAEKRKKEEARPSQN